LLLLLLVASPMLSSSWHSRRSANTCKGEEQRNLCHFMPVSAHHVTEPFCSKPNVCWPPLQSLVVSQLQEMQHAKQVKQVKKSLPASLIVQPNAVPVWLCALHRCKVVCTSPMPPAAVYKTASRNLVALKNPAVLLLLAMSDLL
jgi:hypothetical protein